MADAPTLRADLIRRLGATVGAAKAQSAIEASTASLGILSEQLDSGQVEALLNHLGSATDIIGIAARLLKVQLSLSAPSRGGTPIPK